MHVLVSSFSVLVIQRRLIVQVMRVVAIATTVTFLPLTFHGMQRAVAGAADPEAMIKSAYIYNFTKFVQWPGSINPMELCAIAPNALGESLKAIEKESTAEQAYKVEAQAKEASATGCHIVYIDTNNRSVGALANALHHKPILTVGEGHRFVDEGGMVAFVQKDNKVKLAVNLKAATEAGLKMDPQLLEIAVRVVN
jgi:hypothetical protein